MPQQHPQGIIFVGGFSATQNNTWGGQVQACRSLLKEATSVAECQWFLVDTTMRMLPPPPLVVRALDALKRVLRFCWLLMTRRVQGVLIFTGMSATAFMEKGLMCLIARLFGKRIVLAPRSEVKRFRGLASILNPYVRGALQACDGIICQSQQAKSRLQDDFGCADAKLRIVPAWIDATAYEPLARRRVQRRAGDPITFVFLGWLVASKGVNELLTAFEGVSRHSGGQCRLLLCGHGDELDRLKGRVREMSLESQVEFRGWVDLNGKLQALDEADVLILPSYTEGLPNTLLEAMAANVPCISTPVGGIPSLIDDEVNGLLVPPRDAAALESAMMRLMADPNLAAELAKEGEERVRRSHQLAVAFQEVAEMLNISVNEPSCT